jgi:hypothetical protein
MKTNYQGRKFVYFQMVMEFVRGYFYCERRVSLVRSVTFDWYIEFSGLSNSGHSA